MALKALSARKVAEKATAGAGRPKRSIADDVRAEREAARAAEFTRLVNSFEARIRDIDHALESVMKQLAG